MQIVAIAAIGATGAPPSAVMDWVRKRAGDPEIAGALSCAGPRPYAAKLESACRSSV